MHSVQFDIPFSDIISTFKKKCLNNNNEKLLKSSSEKGVFYFRNFYKVSSKPWFQTINTHKVHRKVINVINRIRSGHTSTNKDLTRFKIVNSAECKCLLYEETVEHIFWQCNRYEMERGKMIRRLRRLKIYAPYSIINILQNINNDIIDSISDFILKSEFNI